MSESFDLGPVDRITLGTVGPPGQRVFYIQAQRGAAIVTLKLEKQQVAALVEHLTKLLADMPTPTDVPSGLDLIEPVEQQWVVGAMAVTPYDSAADAITMVAEEAIAEGEEPGATAHFGLTSAHLTWLVRRGEELLEAGRPPCPFCGNPMDPEGHVCPRSNGHLTR